VAGSFPGRLYAEFEKAFAEETGGLGVVQDLFTAGDRAGAVLFYPAHLAEAAENIARRYEFTELDFPYGSSPQAVLSEWEDEEKSLAEKEKSLTGELEALAEKKPVLDLAEEFYRTLLLRSDARRLAYQSKSVFFLEGWVEAERAEDLRALLKKEISSPYYINFSEVEEKDIPNAPTKLKNKKLFSAFETLTEMYSLPAYDDIDPTPVTTAFYLVFFGMMVADIGYGLVVMLGTLLAKRFLKLERGLAKSVDFFFYLSFPTIAWGIVYGSLFGRDMPFAILSPSGDIITILLLAVVFGWLHIVTGLSISVYASLRKKDVFGAISGGGVWALLLVGLAVLVVSQLVVKSQALFIIGVALCVLAALGIVFLPVIESKRHRVKGLLKGLYALYGATGYIGDLVSYSRLMALGIAGASIAVAFNTIVGSLPFAARVTLGVLLSIALHALNLFLSMLGAYVHGIRLQYVEFFGKFYSGGGRKFSPFKAAEKHIYLIEEHAKSQNSQTR
jgi:V/A-type H+-transporting ATPase subunit I